MASQLPRWRRTRGVSAQQLAERVEALGGRLGRVAITKIETGKRGVSLDEAFLLAAALNVPPPVLFFPLETGEHVAITPENVIHPNLATRWLAGEAPLARTDRTAMGLREWGEEGWRIAARPVQLYRELRAAQESAQDADVGVMRAEYEGDEAKMTSARKRFADRLTKLAQIQARMRAENLNPPWIDRRWVAEMKKLGIDTASIREG